MLALYVTLTVVALAAVVGLYLRSVRKSIDAKGREVTERWDDLHGAMVERSETLPKLVAEVKKTTGFEQDVFNSVEQAAHELAAASSADDTAAAIDDGVTSANSLYAIAEYYPPLATSRDYLALKAEATEAEVRIERDANGYNHAAAEYNDLLSASTAGRAYAKRARLLAYRLVLWRNRPQALAERTPPTEPVQLRASMQ